MVDDLFEAIVVSVSLAHVKENDHQRRDTTQTIEDDVVLLTRGVGNCCVVHFSYLDSSFFQEYSSALAHLEHMHTGRRLIGLLAARSSAGYAGWHIALPRLTDG